MKTPFNHYRRVIPPPPGQAEIQNAIDAKTKPLGSLGRLEALAAQIANVQGTITPCMTRCTLTIFAADHGITTQGVSAYPQAVTRQMVLNFLNERAAANIFARVAGVNVRVVDAGVAGKPIRHPSLITRRIAAATRDSSQEPAMSDEQYHSALNVGKALGADGDEHAICLGEMGIGNTSAAALIAHKILGLPLMSLIGRGTGMDDAGMRKKSEVLSQGAARTAPRLSPQEALAQYGGFEIVMMAGAMHAAAEAGKVVLVDGFIASVAATAIVAMEPNTRQALVFAHESDERGHALLLDALGAKPLLQLGMRLGEGTGALLAWPLLKAATAMLNDMATFESAGVSGRDDVPY